MTASSSSGEDSVRDTDEAIEPSSVETAARGPGFGGSLKCGRRAGWKERLQRIP